MPEQPPTLTPDQFGRALTALTLATKAIVGLPLESMQAYVDHIERVGADHPANSPERREQTAMAGRMIATAMHVRASTALGGKGAP